MFTQTPKNRVTFRRSLTSIMLGVLSIATILYGGFAYHPQKAYAATNSTINFQARLQGAGGAIVPDGYYNIEFKLYSASTGGSALWTEDYYDANGVTAGLDNRAQVSNGYVTVNLGSQTAFPNTINWDQNLYLTMNIGGTTQTATPTYDGEMNPRLPLTAVPYAFRAGQLSQYNATSTFTSTLSLIQPTIGNQAFQVNDQGAAGTYTLCVQGATAANGGCAASTGGSGYIQNQNASAQTSSNFWISGTGIAATALQAPSFDTPSAAALNIGTTNATSINVGKSGVNTFVGGNLSVGTSQSLGAITVANGAWISSVDSTGSGTLNLFSGNSNNQIQVGAALSVDGGIILPTDGGQLTLSDLPIDSSASSGTKESYSLRVGSTNALTVYGEADGSGNSQNVRVAVGSSIAPAYTLDVGGDVNTTGAYRTGTTTVINSSGVLQTASAVGTYGSITGVGTLTAGTWNASTIGVQYGGTGLTSYTVGDLLYASGTTTIGKLSDVATGSCLKSGGTGTAPTWGTCGGGGSYVSLQAGTPGTADTGNLNISGAGIFGGNLSVTGTYNTNTFSATALTFAGSNPTISASTTNTNLSVNANGTGSLNLDTTGAGTVNVGIVNATTINVGGGTANETTNIGNSSGNDTINLGTGAGTDAINIGSAGDTTIIQGGSNVETLNSSGAAIQTMTNSTTAFQVQNASAEPIFDVDTTNTVNIVTNPGFETGISGWAQEGSGTVSVAQNLTKTNTYAGQASLSVTTQATAGQGGKTTAFNSALTSSTTYTLSFYAKLASGTMTTLQAGRADNGSSETNCTLNSTTLSTAGFQRYSCSFTTGTVSGTPYIYIKQSDATARTIYIDAVQLQTGSTATPYYIGAVQLRGVVNSPLAIQTVSDSTSAFQVQNAAGTSNLFTADTLDTRIGIGTATPGYTLDVNGDINLASGATLRIGGTGICTSAGCTGGGGSYVNLQAGTPGTAQTGNINVSGVIIGATGLQAPTLDAAASGALTIGGANATSVAITENTTVLSSSATTAALSILNSSGTTALEVRAGGANQGNALIGLYAGQHIAGGGNNTALGSYAMQTNAGGDNNTVVGNDALNSSTNANANTAIGSSALVNNETGSSNVSVGYKSSLGLTTGATNTSIGTTSLSYNSTGSNNSALGYNANSTFQVNAAGTLTVSSITTGGSGTNMFTVTGHGYTVGYTACFEVASTGTFPGSMAALVPYCFTVVDANNFSYQGTVSSAGSGTITLIPAKQFSNSTAIGANSAITASNQVVLGDSNVVQVTTGGGINQTNAANTNLFTAATTFSANIYGSSYDTAAAGILTLGGVNATTINVGTAVATTIGIGSSSTATTINGSSLTLSSATINLSGTTPTLQSTVTNGNMTIQTNGTGQLTLTTSGAGTVNVGTGTSTTINIGNNNVSGRAITIGNAAGAATSISGGNIAITSNTGTTSTFVLTGPTWTGSTRGIEIGPTAVSSTPTLLGLSNSNVTAASEVAGDCSTSINPGSLYYSTVSGAIRSCINGAWEDVVTTSGLGIITYGIVPDSTATSGTGDLAGTAAYNSGPCRVYVTATASVVGWNSCVAYSQGRKQLITAGTATVSAATSVFQNLCVASVGAQPTLIGTANATETSAPLPTFTVGAPALCLATIKTGTTASTVAAIYDTRVYTTDVKTFGAVATATAPGMVVKSNGSAGQFAPISASTDMAVGVVAAYSGTVSTTTPNAVIVTAGPVAIRTSASTVGQAIIYNSSFAGYASTSGTASTTIYGNFGINQTTYSASGTSCAVSTACNSSVFTILNIR